MRNNMHFSSPLGLLQFEESCLKDEPVKAVHQQTPKMLIKQALDASEAGDDRKALTYLELAMKAMR